MVWRSYQTQQQIDDRSERKPSIRFTAGPHAIFNHNIDAVTVFKKRLQREPDLFLYFLLDRAF